jgi:hypothetical protein
MDAPQKRRCRRAVLKINGIDNALFIGGQAQIVQIR